MTGDEHVYPIAEAARHVTRGRSCPCGPTFEAPCDDCNDADDNADDAGCWKCEKGWVVVAVDHPDTVVVRHRAFNVRGQ